MSPVVKIISTTRQDAVKHLQQSLELETGHGQKNGHLRLVTKPLGSHDERPSTVQRCSLQLRARAPVHMVRRAALVQTRDNFVIPTSMPTTAENICLTDRCSLANRQPDVNQKASMRGHDSTLRQ